MRMKVAIRAGFVVGPAETKAVVVQRAAKAGTELRHSPTGEAREVALRGMNQRRAGLQDPVGAAGVDVVADDFGVDFVLDRVEGAGRDDSIRQERFDRVPTFRAQRVLHQARAMMEQDDVMRRVIRLKAAGEELGRKKMEMLLDRKERRLRVKMFDRSSLVGAGD